MLKLTPRLGSFWKPSRTEAGESSKANGKASKGKQKGTADEAGPSGSRIEKAKSDKEGNPSVSQRLPVHLDEATAKRLKEREDHLNGDGKVSLSQQLVRAQDEDAAERLKQREAHLNSEGKLSLSQQLVRAQNEDPAERLHNSHPIAGDEDAAERLQLRPPGDPPSRSEPYLPGKTANRMFPELINIPEGSSIRSFKDDYISTFRSNGPNKPESPDRLTGINPSPTSRLTRTGHTQLDRTGPALEPESEIQPSSEPAPRLTRTGHTQLDRTGPALESRSASKVGQWFQRLMGKSAPRSES